MSTTKSISIQIPEGTEPGDTLEFQAHGQSLELVVPLGVTVGDVLEIQVATGSSDENREETNENGDVTKVTVGEGAILEFTSRLPADHADAAGENESEEDDQTNDGTYSLPWRSGVEMAQHWPAIIQEAFLSLKIPPRKRILELGSGLGLVGISFAAACLAQGDDDSTKSAKKASSSRMLSDGATTIILSDLPTAMPLLNFNVEENNSFVSSSEIVLTTRALRWTIERPENDSFSKEPPFDCILGSDLLYNIEYIPHLVATLKRLLHPTRGIVLLAVRWRKPDLERAFFRDSGLDWQLVPVASNFCQLSWEDFGDPSKEASNKYFHQTQISVHGKPQPLAEITQDQAKDLPPDEFHAWEQSFIQIYLGRPKE